MDDRQTMQSSACSDSSNGHMLPHLSVAACHILCSAAKWPKFCVEGLVRLSIPTSGSSHAHRCADALALDTVYKQCFRHIASGLYSAQRFAHVQSSIHLMHSASRF